ncbi:MAG: ATP-binding protein [Candidatus Kapaibacteriota bacterium]
MNILPQTDTITVIAAIFPLGVLLILSAFHLLLYLAYKQERYNLFFVLLCGVLAVNGLTAALPVIAILEPTQARIISALFRLSSTGAGLTMILAMYATLFENIPRRFYGLIVPILVLSLTNAVFQGVWSKYVSLLVVCILLTEVARTAFQAISNNVQGAWTLAVGTMLFIATSLFYWLILLLNASLTPLENAFFTLSDMLVMPVTMALWTAGRFAATHQTLETQTAEVRALSEAMLKQEQEKREMAERQNHELERLVRERTWQLQEKMTLLASANEEIQRQVEVQAQQSAEIQFANARLQEQNERLNDLNSEKTEFLGIAAHDLKNPLGNIMMLTEMMRSTTIVMDETKRTEALELVALTAKRMLKLIENLLDINRIEQGTLQVQTIQLDLAAKARLVTDDFQRQAQKKNIHLRTETPEAALVWADTLALTQIMENLISNALKYSPFGKNITVSVEEGIPSQSFYFIVQDEGPGLSDDDKSKLFSKFVRLSAQPTDGEHSTGLGLSIVKRMAETMQGRVWCESELGKGARFIVELPTESRVEQY